MSPELELACSAAREAGELLRTHFGKPLEVDVLKAHDIKLALDVESQKLIEGRILSAFPGHAIFGEEGVAGDSSSDQQWIVDPIDGTVNYYYGIPHFCISIALRQGDKLALGVIYDPIMDEMFVADFEGPATRNGEPMYSSQRTELSEAIVTVGFSKSPESIESGLARYRVIAPRVRKMRMMGSAALAMAYIACGRLDAYIEERISLWDIAAGQVLLERAGGTSILTPTNEKEGAFSIIASNGKISFDGLL